ncbi:MAG: retropepsin-like aspartic protease family protein [Pseudomonadales bacterium]
MILFAGSPMPETKGMGRGMMLFAWLIGLLMLTKAFDFWGDRQINPNQTPNSTVNGAGVREVILQRNRYQHYVTNGRINGSKVQFMLDTGASDVVVPSKVARKLNLAEGLAGYAKTANGTIKIYSTKIDTLQIGDITLRNVRASINPHMGDGDILLGMSALRSIEFVQKGDKLTLRQYAE